MSSIYLTKRNKIQLIFRFSLFIFYIILVVFFQKKLLSFLNFQFFYFKIFQLIWFIIALLLIKTIFVSRTKTRLGRLSIIHYKKNETVVDKRIINQKMNELNRKARNGAIFYLSVVFIFFIFYFYFKLNIFWVYGVSFLFIIFDILCITLWCPFRNYFIKNKCCNTCRIFNWGYIMVTFPLIVIPNFYTYSLIILSFLIFIKWEFNHRKFPERFFEFSNSNLKCQNCKYSLGFCRVRNARMKLNLKEN